MRSWCGKEKMVEEKLLKIIHKWEVYADEIRSRLKDAYDMINKQNKAIKNLKSLLENQQATYVEMLCPKEEQIRLELGERARLENQLKVDKVKEESSGLLCVAHRPPTLLFYGGDVEVDN